MKIKQRIFITDPIAFANGSYDFCFNLFADGLSGSGWIDAGEIELDIDVDKQTAVLAATKALDEEASKIRADMQTKLDRVDQARSELLAITHSPS